MEKELETIKKILAENEDELKRLHSMNRQTASVAGMLFILSLFIYCIYCVFTNPN